MAPMRGISLLPRVSVAADLWSGREASKKFRVSPWVSESHCRRQQTAGSLNPAWLIPLPPYPFPRPSSSKRDRWQFESCLILLILHRCCWPLLSISKDENPAMTNSQFLYRYRTVLCLATANCIFLDGNCNETKARSPKRKQSTGNRV